jgi:hypothetical protein
MRATTLSVYNNTAIRILTQTLILGGMTSKGEKYIV